MPTCSIKQCSARNDNQSQLTVHRFPKNEALRRRWHEVIGAANINPRHSGLHVCSLHFEETSFNRTLGVVRLRDDAVPSVRLIMAGRKRFCCITSCNCTKKNCTLFLFPRTQELRSKWVELVRPFCTDPFIDQESRFHWICVHHFEDRYLNGKYRKHLSIPTLFTEKEVQAGTPDVPIQIYNEGTPSYYLSEPHPIKHSRKRDLGAEDNVSAATKILLEHSYSRPKICSACISAEENFDINQNRKSLYRGKQAEEQPFDGDSSTSTNPDDEAPLCEYPTSPSEELTDPLLTGAVDPLNPENSIRIPCRICLRTDRELKVVDHRLSQCHTVLCGVYDTVDSLPNSKYCTDCEHMLRKVYTFKAKCSRADKIFKRWMNTRNDNENKSASLLYTLLPPTSLGPWTSENNKMYSYIHEEAASTTPGPETTDINYVFMDSIIPNEDIKWRNKTGLTSQDITFDKEGKFDDDNDVKMEMIEYLEDFGSIDEDNIGNGYAKNDFSRNYCNVKNKQLEIAKQKFLIESINNDYVANEDEERTASADQKSLIGLPNLSLFSDDRISNDTDKKCGKNDENESEIRMSEIKHTVVGQYRHRYANSVGDNTNFTE